MSTLNLVGLSPKLPDNILSNSFDKLGRYFLAAEIIHQLAGRSDQRVLDVGGLGSLLTELTQNEITILDSDMPDDKSYKYVRGDATNIPFRDGEYDAVISCDVLEHIPRNLRSKFISEHVRVAADVAIIAAPFANQGVPEAEKEANEFYKELTGEPHRWLQEHIDNRLPREEEVEDVLKKLGVKYVKIRQNFLPYWKIMIKIILAGERMIEPSVQRIVDEVNRAYNARLMANDFAGPAYRTFYVVSKQGDIDLKVPQTPIQLPSDVLELIDRCHCALIGNYSSQLHRFGRDVTELTQENTRLDSALHSILDSRTWKLAAWLRDVKAVFVGKR